VAEGFIPRECRPDVQDVMAAGAWAVAYALAGRKPRPAADLGPGDAAAWAALAGAGESQESGRAGTDRI
jgi:hypothetical protein